MFCDSRMVPLSGLAKILRARGTVLIHTRISSALLESSNWRQEAIVPAHERQAAGRILRPERKREFLAGRLLARLVLAELLGCAPCDVQLVLGLFGKPRVDTNGLAGVDFSISHSRGQLLLGVTTLGCCIGVDLEALDERSESAVSRREWLLQWTSMEATAKSVGVGVLGPDSKLGESPVQGFSGAVYAAITEDFVASAAVASTSGRSTPGLTCYSAHPARTGLSFCPLLKMPLTQLAKAKYCAAQPIER